MTDTAKSRKRKRKIVTIKWGQCINMGKQQAIEAGGGQDGQTVCDWSMQ